MTKLKFFKDTVHDQISYDASYQSSPSCPRRKKDRHGWLMLKLIDCTDFQRLRSIRQNGLANYVFQGLEHSRFTHCMGTAHLAGRMYDAIVRNSDQEADAEIRLGVCAAALLHDIGHGPFSHTLEDVLKRSGVHFDHERMTLRFMTERGSKVARLLQEFDTDFPKQVAAFIKSDADTRRWYHRLVSSQLDADRLDYLERDALQSGIRGHRLDRARLIDMLTVHSESIAVRRGAMETVEAYLVVLDQMYRAIYFHHAVRAANAVLSAALRRAADLKAEGRRNVFPAKHPLAELMENGDKVKLSTYSRIGEYHIWSLVEEWQRHPDEILADLARRLLARDLFKSLPFPRHEFDALDIMKWKAIEMTRDTLGVSEDDAEKYYVCVDEPTRTSYKRYNPARSDDSIYMVGDNRGPTVIENDESDTVRALVNERYFQRLIFPGEIRKSLTAANKSR